MDRYTRVQELTRMMAESVNDVATVQRSLQRALQSGEDQLALQGRLLRAMQDDLMRTRMVEFESLAERLYRVVRQGAKDTGKQVRLDIVGGAIELDRGVLERMTAPFEHLLRNSLAHGIELPAQRVAAGKNATGLIEIRLQPEGNEVTIELRDDGAGLDLGALRARALAQGLLPADGNTSDQAVAELIFAPGLSTANQLSEIAGRGGRHGRGALGSAGLGRAHPAHLDSGRGHERVPRFAFDHGRHASADVAQRRPSSGRASQPG